MFSITCRWSTLPGFGKMFPWHTRSHACSLLSAPGILDTIAALLMLALHHGRWQWDINQNVEGILLGESAKIEVREMEEIIQRVKIDRLSLF